MGSGVSSVPADSNQAGKKKGKDGIKQKDVLMHNNAAECSHTTFMAASGGTNNIPLSEFR